ncbi:MAG: chemotaxis protein CheW [Deltaproteobacteria bacterium]|nr:chemotaxis protein CheW [Deltaproteobacteria bacterium]
MKKDTIDWNAIKERIKKAEEAASGRPGSLSPAETLEKRARALAVPSGPAHGEAGEEGVRAVVFTLGGERFAIESVYMAEVALSTEIVPVPCTPEFVLGIVRLRGDIISVIDLRKFFELPEKGLSDMTRLLVLSNGEMRFGVLADTVEGVEEIRMEELKKLPTLSGVRGEYLAGVSVKGMTVLDGGKLLADRSIIINEMAD